MTLAFWCSNEEGRAEGYISASRYYRLLQHIQGPSNCIFLVYLIAWCIDLFITPIYLLIITWHYARVDWHIQILTAQASPYFLPSRHTSRDGGHGRRGGSFRGASRIWEKKRSNSATKSNLRRRGKLVISHIRERIGSSLPLRSKKSHSHHFTTLRDKIGHDQSPDHGKEMPASVPVSPSESLYSHYSDTFVSSTNKASMTTTSLIDEDLTVLPIHIMITPNSFDMPPIKRSVILSPTLKEDEAKGEMTADYIKMPGSVKRECFVLGDLPSSEDEEDS